MSTGRTVSVRLALVLVACAAFLMAAGQSVSAGGTGAELLTDPKDDTTNTPSTSTEEAADWVRLGFQSDSTYAYFYIQVDAKDVPSAPSGTPPGAGAAADQVAYNIQFEVSPGSCLGLGPRYQGPTIGAWTGTPVFTSACTPPNPFVGFSGGFSPANAAIPPRWICNEALITVEWAELGLPPPPVSSSFANLELSTTDDTTVTTWFDTGTLGTFTTGSNGETWQDAPSLTAAPDGDNGINVTWTPAADNGAQPVTQWRVYRSTDGGTTFTLHATVDAAQNYYLDTGLTTGQEYRYKVANVNCDDLPVQGGLSNPAGIGGESKRSSVVAVTPDYNPLKPVDLTADAIGPGSVDLSWTAPVDCPASTCTPAGTNGSGIKDYEVYRSDDATVTDADTLVCSGSTCTTTKYTDTGLADSTTYWYAVRARDNNATPNVGPLSDVLKVDTPLLNEAPTAVDGEAVIDQDTAGNVLLVANGTIDPFYSDNDGPVANAGNHTVTFVGGATKGTLSITADGLAVEYTPFPGVWGKDMFAFNITDGYEESQANFTVNINARPTPQDDTFAIAMNSDATALDVIPNDTDPFHGTLSLESVGTPDHGSVTIVDGKIEYAPPPGFHGADTFEYVVNDTRLLATATATVHVNAPAMPANDTFSVKKGSVEKKLPVLQNDVDLYYSDWSHQGGTTATTPAELRITDLSVPLQGDVLTDGQYIYYTPNFGSDGIDQVTYTVSDGLTTATATLNITILPGIDLRVKPLVVEEGGSAVVTDQELLVADGTSTDDQYVFTVAKSTAYGTLLLDGVPLAADASFTQEDFLAGRVSYLHDGGELPEDKAIFTLKNATGEVWPIVFRVTVTPVEDPPIVTVTTITVPPGVERPFDKTLLSITDVDSPDSVLLIRPSAVSPLVEFLRHGVVVTEFHYTEMLDGNITVKGKEEGKQALTMFVSDAGSETQAEIPVWVGPANEAPFLTGTGFMTVGWGKTAAVTDANFGWDDDYDSKETRPAGIILVLAQAPLYGDLLKNGVPMGPGESFSQHDIQVGLISYRHGGLGPDSDMVGVFAVDSTPFYPGPQFDAGALNIAIKVPSAHGSVDPDNDGIPTGSMGNDGYALQDPCSAIADADAVDLDQDGISAACDADDHLGPPKKTPAPEPEPEPSTDETAGLEFTSRDLDGDGIVDSADNCPAVSNFGQADMDRDGKGDRCDDDVDGDGVPEAGARIKDNCPGVANPGQEDRNGDGIGDACSQHGETGLTGACRDCGATREVIHAEKPTVSSGSGVSPVAIGIGTLLMLVVGSGVTVWAVRRGMQRDGASE